MVFVSLVNPRLLMDPTDSLFWGEKCYDYCDDIVVNLLLDLKVSFIIRARAELYKDHWQWCSATADMYAVKVKLCRYVHVFEFEIDFEYMYMNLYVQKNINIQTYWYIYIHIYGYILINIYNNVYRRQQTNYWYDMMIPT